MQVIDKAPRTEWMCWICTQSSIITQKAIHMLGCSVSLKILLTFQTLAVAVQLQYKSMPPLQRQEFWTFIDCLISQCSRTDRALSRWRLLLRAWCCSFFALVWPSKSRQSVCTPLMIDTRVLRYMGSLFDVWSSEGLIIKLPKNVDLWGAWDARYNNMCALWRRELWSWNTSRLRYDSGGLRTSYHCLLGFYCDPLFGSIKGFVLSFQAAWSRSRRRQWSNAILFTTQCLHFSWITNLNFISYRPRYTSH